MALVKDLVVSGKTKLVGDVYAENVSGTITKAKALNNTTAIGGANQPVYFGADGKPSTANVYPSFTDTNSTYKMVVANTATAYANTSATNGNTFVNLVENTSTITGSVKFVGSNISVTANNAGVITLSTAANPTSVAQATWASSAGALRASSGATSGLTVGDATHPVYFSNGVPVSANAYPTFTDTNSTYKMVVASTAAGTTSTATGDGNTFVNMIENGSTKVGGMKLVGSNIGITATSDGVITFSTAANPTSVATAGKASALTNTAAIGGVSQPVYFGADGKPSAANTYPTFTDTNSTYKMVVASTAAGTASTATTNGNTFVNMIENGSTKVGGMKLVGSNIAITATSDGIVTFSGQANTDTHHTASLVVASTNSAIANTATTNTNTYINVVENGAVHGSIKVAGTSGGSVTATGGVVTISAPKEKNITVTSGTETITYQNTGYSTSTSTLLTIPTAVINSANTIISSNYDSDGNIFIKRYLTTTAVSDDDWDLTGKHVSLELYGNVTDGDFSLKAEYAYKSGSTEYQIDTKSFPLDLTKNKVVVYTWEKNDIININSMANRVYTEVGYNVVSGKPVFTSYVTKVDIITGITRQTASETYVSNFIINTTDTNGTVISSSVLDHGDLPYINVGGGLNADGSLNGNRMFGTLVARSKIPGGAEETPSICGHDSTAELAIRAEPFVGGNVTGAALYLHGSEERTINSDGSVYMNNDRGCWSLHSNPPVQQYGTTVDNNATRTIFNTYEDGTARFAGNTFTINHSSKTSVDSPIMLLRTTNGDSVLRAIRIMDAAVSAGQRITSTRQYSFIHFVGKEPVSTYNQYWFNMKGILSPNGTTNLQLRAYAYGQNDQEKGATLGVVCSEAYNSTTSKYSSVMRYAYAPDTPDNAPSNAIVTSKFFRDNTSALNYITANSTQVIITPGSGTKQLYITSAGALNWDGNITAISSGGAASISVKRSDISVPSTDINLGNFGFKNSAGNNIAYMDAVITTKGTTRARIYTRDSSGGNIGCTMNGDTLAFYPTSTNRVDLGHSTYRWKNIYASNGTIQTSDERLKDNVTIVPTTILDAWGELDWYQYQFKDSIKEKGEEKARIHNGLIAQKIDSAFKKYGEDASRYGLFCYDKWDEKSERLDEEGNIIDEYKPAGELYSLRYEEALAMEAAYQRRENERLKERISSLEEKIERLMKLLEN